MYANQLALIDREQNFKFFKLCSGPGIMIFLDMVSILDSTMMAKKTLSWLRARFDLTPNHVRCHPIDNVHNSVTPSLMKFLRIPPFFKGTLFPVYKSIPSWIFFSFSNLFFSNEIINMGVP